MLCCALLSGCYSTCASLPVNATGRLSTTALLHVCLCEEARQCECRIPLGLMYLCFIRSYGMREANYRGDACMCASMSLSALPCRILFEYLFFLQLWTHFLNVCLCLYIPQCCVRLSPLLLFKGTDVCMLINSPYHLRQSVPPLALCMQNECQPRRSHSVIAHLFERHKHGRNHLQTCVCRYLVSSLSLFIFGIPPCCKSSSMLFSRAENLTPAVHFLKSLAEWAERF